VHQYGLELRCWNSSWSGSVVRRGSGGAGEVSSRVFANLLSFLIPCTLVALVEVPTKITAAVDPSKIAGTSEYTISHATSSLCL
jgi:hypothetical protein